MIVRSTLLGLGLVVAWSSLAAADFDCKKTETQPECFARLKCHTNEELEDCQKRLRAEAAAAGQQSGGQQSNGQQSGGQQSNGQQSNGRQSGDQRGDDRDHDRGGGDRDDRYRGDRGDNDGGGGGRSYSRRRGGGGGGSRGSFEANKTFGLGIELGEPDGLTGKVFVSRSGAIDFGIGEIYDHYYYGDGLHIYGDYLWHPVLLANTPSFELPFYIGVGARFWDFTYCVGNVCNYDGNAIGIRVPLGIDFDFNNVPLDIFVQAVPVLDFLGGDYYTRYNHREHFGIDGSVGVRFWFK